MSKKVTIVIPVYNLENYIVKCLESIKNQTYTNYEVFIINDGSTDKSERIISAFIRDNKLKNCFLISRENKGLSSARNLGIELAKGELITFIDGDDFVEPDYLRSMCVMLEKTSSELCYCGYRAFYEDNGVTEDWSEFSDCFGKLPDNLDKLCSFGYVWGHIYNMDIIAKNHIRFDENIYCEDLAFNLDYNSLISSFCSVGNVQYTYRVNRQGALTTKVVHPCEKKRLSVHMEHFRSSIGTEKLIQAMQSNIRISRVMWNWLYTESINEILDGNAKEVREKSKNKFSKVILSTYVPRSRKERLFLFLWKRNFNILVLLIKIYYANFEQLRRSKLGRFMSRE